MDKREAREYLGTNHHFNQHMNVIPGAQPPKKKWGITGATPSLPVKYFGSVFYDVTFLWDEC